MAGCADERPRDHPADAEPFSDNLVCDLARAIELRDWNDVFMRRDLEHAVSRRVDDERPGAHVLGAELVEDDRSRCRLVAEDRASRPRGKVCQHLACKAVRKYRKGDVETDSNHTTVS